MFLEVSSRKTSQTNKAVVKPLKQIIGEQPALTRILLGLWLLFCLVYVAKKGVVDGWNNTGGDFNNYYVSAVLASEGEPINQFYDNTWFLSKANERGIEYAKFAPFPPLTAYLYFPLSNFDFMTAKRIWLVLNVLLLLWIPFRLKHIFNLSSIHCIFIISLFFVPLASNLDFGQAYLFLTFLIIEAFGLFFKAQKRNLAALILSVCALLKYFPLLFILYFFKDNEDHKTVFHGLRKQKWLLTFFGSTLLILLATYFAFPDTYAAYSETFSNHLQGDLSGQGKFAIGFQSIDSLFNNLFVFDTLNNPNPLIDAAYMKSIFKALILGGIALFSFLIFKKDAYRLTAINSSIFIIGAFALIPASASYHFLFLFIPVGHIFNWLLSHITWRPLLIFIIGLLATFVIQQHHIPNLPQLGSLNLIIHYPRLWSLLILFGYLAYLKLKTNNC